MLRLPEDLLLLLIFLTNLAWDKGRRLGVRLCKLVTAVPDKCKESNWAALHLVTRKGTSVATGLARSGATTRGRAR